MEKFNCCISDVRKRLALTIKKEKTCAVFLSGNRNSRESLGKREMLVCLLSIGVLTTLCSFTL